MKIKLDNEILISPVSFSIPTLTRPQYLQISTDESNIIMRRISGDKEEIICSESVIQLWNMWFKISENMAENIGIDYKINHKNRNEDENWNVRIESQEKVSIFSNKFSNRSVFNIKEIIAGILLIGIEKLYPVLKQYTFPNHLLSQQTCNKKTIRYNNKIFQLSNEVEEIDISEL